MHGIELQQEEEHRGIRELYRNYNNNIRRVKRLVNTIFLAAIVIIALPSLVLFLPALLCLYLLVRLLKLLLRLLHPREGESRILSMLKISIVVVLTIVMSTSCIVLAIPMLPFFACIALLDLVDFALIRDIWHETIPVVQERMQQSNSIPQTAHDSDVNKDIKSSVDNLIKEHGLPSNKVNTEIEAYVNNSSEFTQDEKQITLECLKRINQNSDKSSNTNLTLKQVLNLVWQACKEYKNASGKITSLDDQNAKDRKNALVKNLIETQTTYGKNHAACFTGTFNKIVETLDGIHSQVEIKHFPKEVISVMAPKMIASITKELFEKDAHKEAIL